MADRRHDIREEVKNIMNEPSSADGYKNQMKRLEALNIESTLMLDETIEKMNETNKALDISNKGLAKTNIKLASRTFWAQIVSVGIAILALLVALFLRKSS